MSNYKDIWQPDRPNTLSEAQLLAYLENRLTPEERHAVEALLSNEGMESDALEGLQSLPADDARKLTRQLNTGLKKVLRQKRRPRRGISGQRWTWIAIGVILLLAIVSYMVMWLARQPGHH